MPNNTLSSTHEQKDTSKQEDPSKDTVRFSISLKRALLDEFDDKYDKNIYSNRSDAIRDLIRAYLVKEEWNTNEEVVGAIMSLYNHHETDEINHIQHEFHKNILSTMHVHLDHDNCVEVIFTRGKANDIQKLADNLKRVVKHVELAVTSTGKSF